MGAHSTWQSTAGRNPLKSASKANGLHSQHSMYLINSYLPIASQALQTDDNLTIYGAHTLYHLSQVHGMSLLHYLI